jgi:hypothetical protein
MDMKKVVVLFVGFVALASFVYFYEVIGQGEREKEEEISGRLFESEEAAISSLKIERPGHETLLFEKTGGDWAMLEPVTSPIDRFAVDGLVRDVASVSRERTFETPTDLGSYGLKEPRVKMEVGIEGKSQRLRIGGDDYTGNQVYVQFEGQEDVHLVGKSLLTACEKDALEFRDKSVLVFEQDDVVDIEIVRAEDTLQLEKEGAKWFLKTPVADEADGGAVSSLLSAVKFARVERFESEQAEDLSPFGLDNPSRILSLRLDGSETPRVLELGGQAEDGIYGKDRDRPVIFVVKQSVTEKLDEQAWDFRQKKIVDVAQDEVGHFRLTRGDVEIAIGHQEADWILEAPADQSGIKTATYKFWYPIVDIAFTSIDDETDSLPEFDNPTIRLELRLKNGSLRVFDFLEEGETYRALRRESGKRGTISKESFEKLVLDPSALSMEE